MTVPDLAGALAKLERAEKRAHQLLADAHGWLHAELDALTQPVVGTWQQAESEFVFEARPFTRGVPDEWAHELGDIVTALRSVLDHTAWALVGAGSDPCARDDEDRAWQIQFPIILGPDKKGRDGATVFVKKVETRLPGVEHRSLQIVEDYQPFKAGESAPAHGLARLVEMSNREKHRTLHLVVAGHAALFMPTDVMSIVSAHRDVEFDPLPAVHVSGRAGAHATIDDIVMRLGARRTGPQPHAEAKFPTALTLMVDTQQRETLEEAVLLVVEVVRGVLTDLLHAS